MQTWYLSGGPMPHEMKVTDESGYPQDVARVRFDLKALPTDVPEAIFTVWIRHPHTGENIQTVVRRPVVFGLCPRERAKQSRAAALEKLSPNERRLLGVG